MTAEQTDARTALATALVTAIDHVGIAVPDLDVAIKWYHDHLGMIVLHEEVNDDQGIREAMLTVRGAPVGSSKVQLMAPIDSKGAHPMNKVATVMLVVLVPHPDLEVQSGHA